jgi:hypothetical protein
MRATSSWTVFAGTEGLTDSTVGAATASVYRLEVLVGIIRNLVEQARVGDVGAKGKEYAVTIGLCFRGLAHADVAAGAADIVDIELLSELLAQFLSNRPRKDIGRAAWRKWHDHAHRSFGIALGSGDARNRR